jgi:hypothetical protein
LFFWGKINIPKRVQSLEWRKLKLKPNRIEDTAGWGCKRRKTSHMCSAPFYIIASNLHADSRLVVVQQT